jgi:hypothetical protein
MSRALGRAEWHGPCWTVVAAKDFLYERGVSSRQKNQTRSPLPAVSGAGFAAFKHRTIPQLRQKCERLRRRPLAADFLGGQAARLQEIKRGARALIDHCADCLSAPYDVGIGSVICRFLLFGFGRHVALRWKIPQPKLRDTAHDNPVVHGVHRCL